MPFYNTEAWNLSQSGTQTTRKKAFEITVPWQPTPHLSKVGRHEPSRQGIGMLPQSSGQNEILLPCLVNMKSQIAVSSSHRSLECGKVYSEDNNHSKTSRGNNDQLGWG